MFLENSNSDCMNNIRIQIYRWMRCNIKTFVCSNSAILKRQNKNSRETIHFMNFKYLSILIYIIWFQFIKIQLIISIQLIHLIIFRLHDCLQITYLVWELFFNLFHILVYMCVYNMNCICSPMHRIYMIIDRQISIGNIIIQFLKIPLNPLRSFFILILFLF